MFFEYPIYLFFFAPDDVPVIIPGLLPLSILKSFIDCVFERGLVFDIISGLKAGYGGLG
ncbi:MAG: hypothetical protein KDD45_04235 [Bdellovibrionales bacterium]|nr:hypothetical protein [Bdellovibrionales bacterium]